MTQMLSGKKREAKARERAARRKPGAARHHFEQYSELRHDAKPGAHARAIWTRQFRGIEAMREENGIVRRRRDRKDRR